MFQATSVETKQMLLKSMMMADVNIPVRKCKASGVELDFKLDFDSQGPVVQS